MGVARYLALRGTAASAAMQPYAACVELSCEPVYRFPGAAGSLGLGPDVWRILVMCHDIRNLGEYEGDLDVDDRLLADLITACKAVAAALGKLPPPT